MPTHAKRGNRIRCLSTLLMRAHAPRSGLELFEQGNGIEQPLPWLQLLHKEGLMAGGQFISRHGRDTGLRETLEIATFFIDSRKPRFLFQLTTRSFPTPPSRSDK